MYCWVIVDAPCVALPDGVVERGPDDALVVDAAVAPEGAVLGGDHGVLDVLRHLVVGDRVAVLDGVPAQLGLAVAVVDERRVGLEVGVRVRAARSSCRGRRTRPRRRAGRRPGRPPAGRAAPGGSWRRGCGPSWACRSCSASCAGSCRSCRWGPSWPRRPAPRRPSCARGVGCVRRPSPPSACLPRCTRLRNRTTKGRVGDAVRHVTLRQVGSAFAMYHAFAIRGYIATIGLWHDVQRPSSWQSSGCCTRDPCTATSSASAST